MGAVDEDLGVCPLPDASPSIRQVCSNVFDGVTGDHAYHNDELLDDQDWEDVLDEGNSQPSTHPSYLLRLKQKLVNRRSGLSSFVKRALNFPCKTRSGMTVAVDTAWQKRDFDSLTSAGLSPGKHTEEYATKRAMKRKAMQEKSQLPSTKRRRNILKQERAVVQNASEVLEGISYQSDKFLL